MKITAHLHYTPNISSWEEQKGKFELWPCKLANDKYHYFITTMEVEVPDTGIPSDEELIQWQVTGLRKEKEELQAATHMKLQELDAKIQQLLCITYQGDVYQHPAFDAIRETDNLNAREEY